MSQDSQLKDDDSPQIIALTLSKKGFRKMINKKKERSIKRIKEKREVDHKKKEEKKRKKERRREKPQIPQKDRKNQKETVEL